MAEPQRRDLSQYLVNFILHGLREQGIVSDQKDVTMSIDSEHMIFLVRHVGSIDPVALAKYLTKVWKGKTFYGLYGDYILQTENMEVDSRIISTYSETEVTIKYKTL